MAQIHTFGLFINLLIHIMFRCRDPVIKDSKARGSSSLEEYYLQTFSEEGFNLEFNTSFCLVCLVTENCTINITVCLNVVVHLCHKNPG